MLLDKCVGVEVIWISYETNNANEHRILAVAEMSAIVKPQKGANWGDTNSL